MAPDVPENHDRMTDVVARAVDHGLLRQALELAVVVARSGVDARPPIPPPGPLRPLLRHTKWTARARTTVARVLETDDEFRFRVAEAAEHLDSEHLGAASRLWLVRSEGWQEELADEVKELDAVEDARQADREERQAKRQVGELTAELERRRQEAEDALRRASELEAELGEVRRERREAAALADHLDEQLAQARADQDHWRKAAEEAECLADHLRQALEGARHEVSDLQAEGSRLRERVGWLQRELTEAEERQEADNTATADLRQSVARAVGEAATAAAALGEALAVAARSIVERAGPPPGSTLDLPRETSSLGVTDPLGIPNSPDVIGLPNAKRPVGEASDEPRRQAQLLPPAVFEDSPEAAAHLVRSGVLLLVDGYNVSLFAWPELPLPAQRHRVTTSLAELAARTGASVRVVFDGDEQVAYPESRGGARTPVRVLFSTPGVDADEVIIGLVEDHPHDQAVVVATNDRRVQDEVRRRGANVLTTPQLLALLRRTGPR